MTLELCAHVGLVSLKINSLVKTLISQLVVYHRQFMTCLMHETEAIGYTNAMKKHTTLELCL